MGAPPELPLHTLIRIEPQLDVLELCQGERDRPWLELLEGVGRQPQARGFGRDAAVARLADRIA